MNNSAKIRLSEFERELVRDKEWLFAKQRIIDKVYFLFGDLHQEYRNMIQSHEPFFGIEIPVTGGKISRGENYKGLPYIILDYPAIFSREHIIAIRTFFWWGNFFSISLHLSGKYFTAKNNLEAWLSYFRKEGFSICVNDREWDHDFHDQNFIDSNLLSQEHIDTLSCKDFFKVSKKVELDRWDDAPELLKDSFLKILEFLAINFPAGETIP